MKRCFLCAWAVPLLHFAMLAAPFPDTDSQARDARTDSQAKDARIDSQSKDARIQPALYRLAQEAASFWKTAPGYTGREELTQRAFTQNPAHKGQPQSPAREIVSLYTFNAFQKSPEALREFRLILTIDGKPVGEGAPETAAQFASELASGSDVLKKSLLDRFEKECLAGSATDFGQLVLLFGRANQRKYAFQIAGNGRIGADSVLRLAYTQTAGSQALRIQDGGKMIIEKLQGEIWVRQADYLPLRITIDSLHQRDHNALRDQAQVDYAPISGALLPAAVTYRRYVNTDLALESIYRYTDWQRRP